MVIVAVLVGIVAVATALGLLWKNTTGRVRRSHGEAAEFVSGDTTLLQFSTDYCAPCAQAHVTLDGIAREYGIGYVDVNVTERPDLANRFNLLQSPTTLILDANGAIRARIGGAPRPADIRAELNRLTTSRLDRAA